jgi:hypothetical protein
MRSWREYVKKLAIGVVILFIFFVVFISLAPLLFKPDLRYERSSYSVSRDRAITSCFVRNYGRGSAERTRMSVGFLSKILDIWVSPEPAGRILGTAPDQRNAVLELENIAPKGEVTVFFAVERPQDRPFDFHLLDISRGGSVRERAVPMR